MHVNSSTVLKNSEVAVATVPSHAEILSPIKENLKLMHQEAVNDAVNSVYEPRKETDAGNEMKHKVEAFLDRLLPFMTYGNALINSLSILTSMLSFKKENVSEKAKKLEELGLLATRAQAVTVGASFLQKGFKTNNIILSLTGLAQGSKLLSGFNRLMRFSGISSSLDQIPAVVNKLTGKSEYKSFSESWKENTRVFGEVWREFRNNPRSFWKHMGASSAVDRNKTLVPLSVTIMLGAILSNLVDTPLLGPLRKPLVALTAGGRHGAGTISDYVLSQDEENPDNKTAGVIYLLGSALDYSALFMKDKIGHLMHQTACLLNPIGEIFLLKGAEGANHEKAIAKAA